MKKIFFGAILLTSLVACDKKPDYAIISGKVTNPSSSTLSLMAKDELIKEITINADGTFRDTIRNINQNHFRLINKVQRESLPLFLKNGTDLVIEFDGSFSKSKISGKDAELSNYLISVNKLLNSKFNTGEIFTKNPTEYKLFIKNLFDSLKQDIDNRKLDKKFAENQKKWANYTYLMFLDRYPSNHQYATQSPTPVDLPADFFADKENLNYDIADDFENISSYQTLVHHHIFSDLKDIYNVQEITATINKIKALKSENIKESLSEELVSFIAPNNPTNETIYNFITENVKNSKIKEETTKQFELVKKLVTGAPAPSFNYENYNGGTTSLESLRGKLVYIDVWATWCGPCRMEIPYLKQLEKDFHNQAIEFVSISIDEQQNKSIWKNFIEKEQLKGIQLIANDAWRSQFVVDCLIKGIPRFMLIDKSGNIIDIDAPRPSDPQTKELISTLLKQ